MPMSTLFLYQTEGMYFSFKKARRFSIVFLQAFKVWRIFQPSLYFPLVTVFLRVANAYFKRDSIKSIHVFFTGTKFQTY